MPTQNPIRSLALAAALLPMATAALAETATWIVEAAEDSTTSIYVGGDFSPLYRVCFTGGTALSIDVEGAERATLSLDSCTDVRGTEIRIVNRAGNIASGTYQIIAIPGGTP